jgi:hypothetical protein
MRKKAAAASTVGVGGVAFATARFLAGLDLEGARSVLAAVALMLAERVEGAPAYAVPKYAAELRVLLAELGAAAREQELERGRATVRANHEAGRRRQKELLAELGVPDVNPEELRRRFDGPEADG